MVDNPPRVLRAHISMYEANMHITKVASPLRSHLTLHSACMWVPMLHIPRLHDVAVVHNQSAGQKIVTIAHMKHAWLLTRIAMYVHTYEYKVGPHAWSQNQRFPNDELHATKITCVYMVTLTPTRVPATDSYDRPTNRHRCEHWQ